MCRMTKHHLYWPKRNYRTALEQAFRDLPENVVELDEFTHQLIHDHQHPPEMPSHEVMLLAVKRSVDAHIYAVNIPAWNAQYGPPERKWWRYAS